MSLAKLTPKSEWVLTQAAFDGFLAALDRDRDKAGEKYELLAKNELGEECNSSPAAAQGQLFIRTAKHLWCIGSPRSAKK